MMMMFRANREIPLMLRSNFQEKYKMFNFDQICEIYNSAFDNMYNNQS